MQDQFAVVQNPEARHRKGDIVHPLRQITTNPMKKGGYGFNKTTLSERKGYKGVVSFPTAFSCVLHIHVDAVVKFYPHACLTERHIISESDIHPNWKVVS